MWHLTIMAFYATATIGLFLVAGCICACYEYYLKRQREKYSAKRRITIMQDFS